MKKRLRFITANPMQIKYLVLIMASITVPLFVVGGCLYYLIFQIMAEQLGIPESIAYNLMPVLTKINFLLLVGIPPIIIIIFLIAIKLTHKLVGPIKRLEKDLTEVAEGNYDIRLKIRKDDDLRPFADAINKIIDKLEKK